MMFYQVAQQSQHTHPLSVVVAELVQVQEAVEWHTEAAVAEGVARLVARLG